MISGDWFFTRSSRNWHAKQTGYVDLPREAGIATWQSQPCVLPQAALRPPMIFGALRLMFYGSITSGDVLRASLKLLPVC